MTIKLIGIKREDLSPSEKRIWDKCVQECMEETTHRRLDGISFARTRLVEQRFLAKTGRK
jgi:hypothetical protein